MKTKFPDGRPCKYCGKPVKINYSSGRNKGYLKTCGSKECLSGSYKNRPTYKSKAIKEEIIFTCKHCGDKYKPTASRQKWCTKCVPDQSSRAIMQRYNISRPDWLNMLEKNSGICPICLERKAIVVDHNHYTGKVRGLLCYDCNLKLSFIEDKNKLKRALEYLYAV